MLFIIPLDPFLGRVQYFLVMCVLRHKDTKKEKRKEDHKKNEEKTYEKKGVLDVKTKNCQHLKQC